MTVSTGPASSSPTGAWAVSSACAATPVITTLIAAIGAVRRQASGTVTATSSSEFSGRGPSTASSPHTAHSGRQTSTWAITVNTAARTQSGRSLLDRERRSVPRSLTLQGSPAGGGSKSTARSTDINPAG